MFKKKDLSGLRVWITGASGGIGSATAKALIDKHCVLVLSGRNEDKLTEIAELDKRSLILPFDVCDRGAHLHAASEIKRHLGGIDIVIFNAGVSQFTADDHFSSQLYEYLMKVNFMSMVYGVEASLPLLRHSHKPHIVGISSAACYFGLPTAGPYCASKAAARRFLESLRVDLSKENIPVSIVCPGFVKTKMIEKNTFPMPLKVTPEKAAYCIINGIEKSQAEIHFPKLFTYSMKLFGSLPNGLRTKILSHGSKIFL